VIERSGLTKQIDIQRVSQGGLDTCPMLCSGSALSFERNQPTQECIEALLN
jgi:hypothetical protein